MTDESVVGGEVVTKFLLNTSRLYPRLNKHAIETVVMCAKMASACRHNFELVPLVTGSVAEFYVEPMLRHVGDVDIMYYQNNILAIPRGHPPPTQLPPEFHNYVEIYEIFDSHLSGYVYLKLRYLLTKCTDCDTYNAVECEEHTYLTTDCTDHDHVDGLQHGPAYQYPGEHGYLPVDRVRCVRCLSWPPQAADWPTRHRNYGWPDSATVIHVVSNGCDFVGVAHRHCIQNEWMRERQCRLSFSRTEIALINSWMPVQQIVYHVLRVFMKTEQLTESANNSHVRKLSNYHTKTLMLWACELKPKNWWTNDLSLIKICVELLHTLAVWLTETRCPHYFINNCNLVDKSFALQMIASRLLLIGKSCLSSWFVNYYIRQSVQICPESVSRLFDDISTSTELEYAVSVVVEWRLNRTTADMRRVFVLLQLSIASHVSLFMNSDIVRSCVAWMIELSKTDTYLSIYFTAAVFLYVSRKIRMGYLVENLLKALPITAREFVVSSNYYDERTFSFLNEVVILARKYQLSATNSVDCNISKLVELLWQSAVKLLTMFRQLEKQDFSSVVTIVTTDYEALYAYKHGDYQQCLQLSTQNLHALLNADWVGRVLVFPEIIQFLDEDIVSLIALTLIVNPENRRTDRYASISQRTLSLYLMTQCQLKLRHSRTSLSQILGCIEVAERKNKIHWTLDHLTVKSTKRKLVNKLLQLETVCRRTVL